MSVSLFYIISFRGLGQQKKTNSKKKTNFQQKIDANFRFRILGMTKTHF